MRRTLTVFLLFFPTLLLAQEDSSTFSRRLLIRVPVLNGGLVVPLRERTSTPVQNSFSFQSLGSGIWYFNTTKFSYQLDLTLDFNFGKYQMYALLNKQGPIETSERTRNFGQACPALGFALNYELADLGASKFYVYAGYQLYGFKWTSRSSQGGVEPTPINDGVYDGNHYADVYKIQLTSKARLQQLRTGVAICDNKNRFEARFFLAIDPAQDYLYTATSQLSTPGPTIEWTERTRTGISGGVSVCFNVPFFRE